MNSIKKHILRKKLHMSKKEFENFEQLIKLAKAILIPILIKRTIKILLKMGDRKCRCNHHHHEHMHKMHRWGECECHRHHPHHHHHHDHCHCDDRPDIKEIVVKYSPLILKAIEQYKLNNPNNEIINGIEEILKEMKK